MTIYVDSLIALNLIINYLILLSAAKISGVIFNRIRLLLAAALGAVYAAAVLLPGTYFLSCFGGKTAVCLIMTAIAFGFGRHTIKLTLITVGVSVGFAGAAMMASMLGGNLLANISSFYVPVDMKTLILVTAIAYVVVSTVYKKTASAINRSIGTVDIAVFDKKIKLRCLRDTGNSLTDPMTNVPITVVGMEVLKKITGVSFSGSDPVQLLEELNLSHPNAKTRLIPYSSVGENGGLLVALKCDSIKLEGYEIKGGLIAFSPNRLSNDDSYDAIVGCIGG